LVPESLGLHGLVAVPNRLQFIWDGAHLAALRQKRSLRLSQNSSSAKAPCFQVDAEIDRVLVTLPSLSKTQKAALLKANSNSNVADAPDAVKTPESTGAAAALIRFKGKAIADIAAAY